MVGRGTRLCENLFGPGEHKKNFRIFDFCQNLEFFGQDPATKEAPPAKSLTERIFASRLSLVRALESDTVSPGLQEEGEPFEGHPDVPPSIEEIISETRERLGSHVGSMNLDNFVVRSKRLLVEKYQDGKNWQMLDDKTVDELSDIAGLPNTLAVEGEEAKRFDLLMLSLQLALLNGEQRFDKLKKQLVELCEALDARASVPAIKQHIQLIEEVQLEDWWEGVTVPLLELVRRRLRKVVHLVDRTQRNILYANFEDTLGNAQVMELPGTSGVDIVSFTRKARAFLRAHEDNIALNKVRNAKPLTGTDLQSLEAILLDAGIGDQEDVERAAESADGFGNFIRTLVGLDKAAATAKFERFITPEAIANQIEFINMIIDHLTENGVMDAGLLYESPFKDIAPKGPEELFADDTVVQLVRVIRETSEPGRGEAVG
jgi:type I restriction enzyme R subunit